MPKTKEIIELKLNMLDNIEEKYNQLLADGMNENEAIGTIISGIGTTDDIINELGVNETKTTYENSTPPINNFYNGFSQQLMDEYYIYKKRSGLRVAISVCGYILSSMLFILFENNFTETSSILIFFIIIALSTANLIVLEFSGEKYKPIERMLNGKEYDSINLMNNSSKRKYGLISSTMWCILTCIYLLLGFFYNMWHLGWIIFIFGAALDSMVRYFVIKD